MRKYLVVGFTGYGLMNALAKAEPNVIIFEQREINNANNAEAIVDIVKMVDAVVFADCGEDERLCYEVAIAMNNNLARKLEVTDIVKTKKVDVETDERVDVNGVERDAETV